MPTKFIFVTGGVLSSLGKGIGLRLHRLPAGKPGLQGHHAEMRSLYQRGSRDHESLPARGGLRHRRRGRDRSGPGPLRAVHRRPC